MKKVKSIPVFIMLFAMILQLFPSISYAQEELVPEEQEKEIRFIHGEDASSEIDLLESENPDSEVVLTLTDGTAVELVTEVTEEAETPVSENIESTEADEQTATEDEVTEEPATEASEDEAVSEEAVEETSTEVTEETVEEVAAEPTESEEASAEVTTELESEEPSYILVAYTDAETEEVFTGYVDAELLFTEEESLQLLEERKLEEPALTEDEAEAPAESEEVIIEEAVPSEEKAVEEEALETEESTDEATVTEEKTEEAEEITEQPSTFSMARTFQAAAVEETLRGVGVAATVNVYSDQSRSSAVLKSYPRGSELVYRTLSSEWYSATVYVNGRARSGFIHVNDVDTLVSNPVRDSGYASKLVTNVFSNVSRDSGVLKQYPFGSRLVYTQYSENWYEATVYVNGKARSGFINANDISDSQQPEAEALEGVALKPNTNVYQSASTGSGVWKSYSQGTILSFRDYSDQFYIAKVYVNGIARIGYINAADVELKTDSLSPLKGIALNAPTNVYTTADKNSPAKKSYAQGTILSYTTYSADWYQAKIYLSGQPHLVYIHKSDVENINEVSNSLQGISLKNPTNVYSLASSSSDIRKSYPPGTVLQFSSFSQNWYKATVYVSGKARTGYIHTSDIEIAVENQTAIEGRANFEPTSVYASPSLRSGVLKSYSKYSLLKFKTFSENWYEASVYVNGSRKTGYIHKTHVNTSKEIINKTNYSTSFNTMLDLQMSQGMPKADGQGLYDASRNLVSYYMNPANFADRNDPSYFQFLVLSEPAGTTASELNSKVLNGKGILEGLGSTFIQASKTHGVNELYLISHALHETGNGTSPLAQGVEYNGQTVYNMFGIGAIDGAAVAEGSKRAYNEGWFTPEQAIIGGARFISSGYISAGQDTLYKMKWNPENPATHQYATHVSWALSQTTRIQNMYKDLSDYTLIFDVPNISGTPDPLPGPPQEFYPFPAGAKGTVTDNLNFRDKPSTTNSKILANIPRDTVIDIVGENGLGWYQVKYNGQTGWVSAGYVTVSNVLEVVTDSLRVRSSTNTSNNDNIIGSVTKGQLLIGITRSGEFVKNNEWYQIRFNGGTGWISSGTSNETYLIERK
ncbi:SH3 domain-containing protein [Jeotgalibacillus haloalkalitolerans]|uniref:SH3 domain-containing protein n=1 Tax=Jeotgalibacillus haloalkalitolerans TaxID=3104292 RepID=A0ABU5KJI1_9BACL|nr:SH3 domain-containing protein [Jeotgalibacillus sp. HH7-29]MDZ5711299.1 SH3 domain-containing protein [Jeotgalibacillus sp. HH7-29]